jgi:hypothetical protein
MTVSKRTRYEVLKRDNYTCRYCGATAPAAIITIDHVTPSALGGGDDPSNLVTACRDCNYGKASSNPDASPGRGVSDDAVRWAVAIRAAAAEMLAEVTKTVSFEDAFFDAWESYTPNYGYKPSLPPDWESSLARWLAAGLPFEVIKQATYYALAQKKVPNSAKFRYLAKICWNKISDLQDAPGPP